MTTSGKTVLAKKKKLDAERNLLSVKKAVMDFYRANDELPTIMEIAEVTGLGHNTVANHLKSLTFEDYFGEVQKKVIPLAQDVIMAVHKKAAGGDIRAAKLFFQLLGWTEKTEVKDNKEIVIKLVKETINEKVTDIEKAKEIASESDSLSMQAVPAVFEVLGGQEVVPVQEGDDSGDEGGDDSL